MTVESFYSISDQLGNWRKEKGFQWLFVDLDDTLVNTNLEFTTKMRAFSEYLSSRIARTTDPEKIFEAMGKTLSGLRSNYKTNPILMTETARLISKEMDVDFFDEQTTNAVFELTSIYNTAPKPFTRSVETMQVFRAAGFWIAIITNSDFKWAHLKTDTYNFPYDYLFTIPSTEDKNGKAWSNCISTVTNNHDSILVAGDSWTSDVQGAISAGIPSKNIYRIQTNYNHSNYGKINGVIEVRSFSEIPAVLLGN